MEADLDLPPTPPAIGVTSMATATSARSASHYQAFRKRSTLLSRTTSFSGLANQSILVGASKDETNRKAVMRKGMVFKTATDYSTTTSTINKVTPFLFYPSSIRDDRS